MKLILANIGNTNAEFARYEDGGPTDVGAHSTASLLNWDFPACLDGADLLVAAAVVPAVRPILEEKLSVHWLTAQDDLGLDFSLVDSSKLGADRIANALAVLDKPLPAVVVDCGTAITFEVVNEQKQFAGGAILPGRGLARKSLNTGTAQLPEVPYPTGAPGQLGTNTVAAIQLGIDLGALGAVEKILQMISRDLRPRTVIAVGGDRDFFVQNIDCLQPAEDNLTLKGVARAAQLHTR